MTVASAAPPAASHVELVDVSRSFGGVHAVRGVSLRVARGEVHALIGENGAGKSTLSKIIAGALTPDDGLLRVDGQDVSFGSPRDALHHGIASIAQELTLVGSLSVAENVYLGAEPRRAGFVRRRRLRQDYDALARAAGFQLPASAVVGTLRTADQQKVEIMRAMCRGASMIIMDEPTAALSHVDTQRLHEVVRELARSGRTVLLISHFLSEVLSLADTISIMRDGALVRSGPARDESEESLIEAMLGRSLGSVFPPRPPSVSSDDRAPVLTVNGLRAPGVRNVSLTVFPGEIVGIAGLVGSGRSELAHALVGATRVSDGNIRLDGRALALRSPTDGLRAGIFLIPESRKVQGLVLQRSVLDNITLANLADYSRAGVVNGRRQRQGVSALMDRLAVRVPNPGVPVSSLSGGNQQKAMFARAMLCHPRVLIADEPTRGVDVGSRRAIYELLIDQARDGAGVLVISSDVEELLGIADRTLVMRAGTIVADLRGEQMTEQRILTAAFDESTRNATSRDQTGE
ncbi:MAG TPA: sugar ABC transporter ATP-binding protein [Micromonosporaceae bacterium]|nr:sugar ABC transporter ATP-binding protein [Micromonosporaceae bacterium]